MALADGTAVVIPAYEAAETLRAVLAGVRAALPDAVLIVVDDGSRDATARAAAGAQVLRHDRNLGKGAALRTGIAAAVAGGAQVIVTLDADGQHPPSEAQRLLATVRLGAADLVLGARARRGSMPLSRRVSNWLSSVLASRAVGTSVPDAQTGFRAFTRAVALAVQPSEARYEWELAFLLGAAAAGFRIASVPVSTVYEGARSHFGYVGDTVRVARVFARHARRIVVGGR